jgi:hypothetical protein
MNARVLTSFAAFAALMAAGCGGNSGGTSFSAPTPGPTCAANENVQMIYPVPGATAVPDNPQQLVFAMPSALPDNWDAYINTSNTYSQSSGGLTSAGLETITAAQLPSPHATPNAGNVVYQSITLAGGLSSGTTYYIWLNNVTNAGNCTPLGPLGSFTTQ